MVSLFPSSTIEVKTRTRQIDLTLRGRGKGGKRRQGRCGKRERKISGKKSKREWIGMASEGTRMGRDKRKGRERRGRGGGTHTEEHGLQSE